MERYTRLIIPLLYLLVNISIIIPYWEENNKFLPKSPRDFGKIFLSFYPLTIKAKRR